MTKRKWQNFLTALGQPFVSVVLALVLGAVIIGLSGENVLKAYGVMLKGAFGDGYYLSSTLSRATPIIMGGLAVCIAWRSGYEAMGGEGQMIFGALVAAIIAYYLPVAPWLRAVLAMAGACLVGALYSVLSGWLYERWHVTFIISTLMSNYIANYVASYLTIYKLKDPQALDINASQTGKIVEGARLPRIFKSYSLHWGFILAVLCVVLVYILLNKTEFGYKSRMNGLNSRFALYGGINARKMLYTVMILSGVCAGFGGALEVLGSKYRYIDQMIFSTGYAWSGMTAALLANFNPIGTMVASILLAGLATGGAALQRSTSIPVETVNMIEGVITILMSVKLLNLISVRYRHSKKQEGGENA